MHILYYIIFYYGLLQKLNIFCTMQYDLIASANPKLPTPPSSMVWPKDYHTKAMKFFKYKINK